MVVSQLRPEGVTDKAVLAAMSVVPRERFVSAQHAGVAYLDRVQRTAAGAPIYPPAELGKLLTELEPIAGETALVIGGGGDYSAAVLSEIGLTVDRSDGPTSLPKKKYDVILVEGGAECVPDDVSKKLKSDGRIGLAIFQSGVARLAIGAAGSSGIGFRSVASSQMPLLGGFEAKKPEFVF